MSETAQRFREFKMPDVGEGLTEAEILQWYVKPGDPVTDGQMVVEVETAKAAVEVPCPFAGVVAELHAATGEVIEVGKPLITIGSTAERPAEPKGFERHREEEKAGSGNVLIGYGTGHGGDGGRRRARVGSRPTVDPPSRSVAPRVLSPVVRKLARSHDIDLATVTGSGAGGVIVRSDVEAAIAANAQPSVPVRPTEGETRIPLRGLRGAVAEKLARSRREIPDASTWVDVDATGLVAARAALKPVAPQAGLLALLARICVAGLRRFPELNSTVDTERAEIVRYQHINLGFAAQTPRGLVVPVVRDAHLLSTAELGERIAELVAMAREGAIAPDHLTGGTFTLNNYGVFGVDGSTPIINHPEAAIIGVGRIVDKPWAHEGQLALRKVTQVSLSFDHRVCDGGAAGGFLRYVADCIENPVTMLAHL